MGYRAFLHLSQSSCYLHCASAAFGGLLSLHHRPQAKRFLYAPGVPKFQDFFPITLDYVSYTSDVVYNKY